jgi:hypothetical protein
MIYGEASHLALCTFVVVIVLCMQNRKSKWCLDFRVGNTAGFAQLDMKATFIFL